MAISQINTNSIATGAVTAADLASTLDLTGKTLTSPTIGGTPVMEASVITSGTAVASTSGTSIDFTGIPSWVKRITVMFNGVSLSGTDAILIRLGDSGGLEATGYTSSGTGFTGGAGSTVNNTTGFIVPSDTATYLISGIVVITNISGNTWVESGSGKLATAASWVCGGDKTLSDTLTQISITRTGTNTFDAGSINILYE